jgi:LPXTG-site transpeptidase (sortase) family protein
VKKNWALSTVSALVLSLGAGTAGYAGLEIASSNPGAQYLPQVRESLNSQKVLTIRKPKVGDVIGTLSIPSIKSFEAIIEGTGTKELKRGVGHYTGSVIPGVSDNSVLSGHRDTVFRKLGDVKIGDLITVKNDYGTFVYEVHRIRIVKANDRTVIVPSDDPILTLSTCYPFRFIGNAPKRYVVQAGLVIGEPLA